MSKRENLGVKIDEKGESTARKAKLARVCTHKRLGTSRDVDTGKRGTMVIRKSCPGRFAHSRPSYLSGLAHWVNGRVGTTCRG